MTVADAVIIVVTIVWVVSVAAALYNPSLRDPQIHLIFSAVVGGYIATRRPAKGGDGK